MTSTEKKAFFRRPTRYDLRDYTTVKLEGDLQHMASQIATLEPQQKFFLEEDLLHGEPAHRYKKRGPSVPLVSPRSRDYRYVAPKSKTSPLVLETHPSKTPLQVLELQIENLDRFDLTGYGWIGEGRDQRYHHVSLGKLLGGARLFAYEHQMMPGREDDVKVYEGIEHATEQGLIAVTSVSSESKNAPRYQVEVRGVPIRKRASSKRVQTSHTCVGKMWSETRYSHVFDPERIMFCKHEVAAYHKIADYCVEHLQNKYPALLSPFVPPSQVLVDFYKKLLRQGEVLSVNERGRRSTRLMNEAEMEQFLFAYVKHVGVRKSFRSNPADPKYKLKDRDWS